MFRSLFDRDRMPRSIRGGGGTFSKTTRFRNRLTLEHLEERVLPTIVFSPVFGAESIKSDGGYRLNSPPLFLIFWGSYWDTAQGQPEAAAIVDAAKNLVAGPYFSGLSQYGADGKVTWGDFDYDHGDPPPNFSSGVLYNVVRNLADHPNSQIPRPTTPSHLPIYMVFTPPGTTSDQAGASGYHTASERVRFDTDNGFQQDLFYFGWVSTDHNLDDATATLSHEIAETITDATVGGLPADFPFGSVPDGLHLNPGNTWSSSGSSDPGDEICDREATNYHYRVNGVWVQSYWGDQKGGYQIFDGNQQTFVLHTTSDGSRELDVLGDQRSNPNDSILLTTDSQQNLVVVLNDETAQFDTSYNIKSVLVLSGGGSDTINVDSPPAWAAIYINSEGGNASVTVSRMYDGVGDAPVTVQSPLAHTSLSVVDAQAGSELNNQTGVILDADATDGAGFGEVRFTSASSNPAPVNYLYMGIDSLTITCPPDIALASAGESDSILATGVPTTLITQSSNPTVSVGNGGSLTAIQGALTIDDRRTPFVPAVPVNDIIVDDQADSVARTVNVGTVSINSESYGQVAFSGGIAPINYLYAASHSVTVNTGTGSTKAYVAALGVQTNLIGHGVDAQVILGNANGFVQDLAFPLTVSNATGGTTLMVNDVDDPVLQTVTLDTTTIDSELFGRVNIPGMQPVYYKAGDTTGITLQTGLAGAQVNVLATLAPTSIVAHGPKTTVNVGDAGHIEGELQNDLFITGPANSVVVNVDGSNDSGTLGGFLDLVTRADGTYGRIYNLAAGMIYYQYSDTSSLALQTGTGDGSNPALVTVSATGVPTTLTGHGPTAVNVGQGSLQQINGELTINNVVAQTTVTIDDQNDSGDRLVGLSSVAINGAAYGRVTFFIPYTANINYQYSSTDSVTVDTGMGGASVQVAATGVPTTVIGHGPATMISVGSNQQVQDIAAPLTLRSATGSIQVAVDDFEDSQAEQITHDSVLIDGVVYGRISGLAPAQIDYQYAGTESMAVTTPYNGGTTNILATGAPLSLSNFQEPVNVGNEGSLQDIRGDLSILWGSNAGVLNIDDSADPEARTATYDTFNDSSGLWERITGLAPATIIHRAGENATLRLGIGGGTFSLLSSVFPQALALIDNGDTTVKVGNAGEILGVFPPVNVTAAAGTTHLVTDNSAASGGLVLDATGNQATLTIGSNGGYPLKTITFTGGPDSDVTVNVTGVVDLNNTTPFKTTINASGNSYNYLTVQGFSPNTQVVVNAGAGTNTLYGPNVPNIWHITGTNSGDLGNGVLEFNNYANIYGGSGDDYFYFLDGGSIAGELDGGGGTDTLDYSGWSGDVLFDPRIYQATGVGNLNHVENAVGGRGSSILVGYGAGTNNVLKGGTGRNLLIAGFGMGATLIGNDDGDILIGGTTIYDTNPAALEAIMAEWARTDEDYNTRVANLLNGNGVPRLDNTTVFYNNGGNTLLGGAGPDLFFGRTATDQTNWNPNTEVFVEL